MRNRLSTVPAVVVLAILHPALGQASPTVADHLKRADRVAWLTDWSSALPMYTEAEAAARDAKDARNEMYARFGRLRAQMQVRSLGELSTEIAADLASPFAKQDPALRLRGLTVKGDIDLEWDVQAAEYDWQGARQLALQLGDAGWVNRANGELGMIAFLKGNTGRATTLVQEALETATRTGDVGGQLRYLSAVANGLLLAGYAPISLGFTDRALKFAADHPEVGFPFVAYSTRVLALLAMKQLDQAETFARTAMTAARAGDSRIKEIELQLMLAQIADARGHADQSVQFLGRAAATARAGGVQRLLSDAEEGQAAAYLTRGDLMKAKMYATSAVVHTRAAGSRFTLPVRLGALADILVADGRFSEADRLYNQAADIVDGIMANVPSRTAQARLVGVMSDLYTKHFALMADQSRDPAKAFRIIERTRARALADVLRTLPIEADGSSGDDANRQDAISALQLRLINAATATQRRQILDLLWEAEQRAAVPAPDRRLDFSATYRLDASVLQAQLGPTELVLEYVLADSRSYCLVVTNRSLRVVPVPAKKRVEELAAAFAETLRTGEGDARRSSADLYRALLEPVIELQRTQRVFIVPDGVLHRIPLDLLVNSPDAHAAQTTTVMMLPSASVLALIRTRPDGKEADRPLLAIGGVPYERMFRPTAEQKAVRSADAAGLFDVAPPIAPPSLPLSLTEVRAVSEALGTQAVVLIGDRATESAFKAQNLAEYQAIHFAVHAFADQKAPQRAALVLLSDPSNGQDGLLQPREIARLRLNARVVVLSACDTAVGPSLGQEGVLNLARAFFLAGARSVVMTLWRVSDVAATALMRRFFEGLAAGKDVAEALRRAEQEVVTQYGHDSMSTVAAFQLVGDGAGKLDVSRH